MDLGFVLRPHFGARFFSNKNNTSEIVSQKRAPTRRKQVPIPLPGASRTGSHYQELFEHKQLFGHKLKQLFEFLSENVDWAENWIQSLTVV